MNDYLKYINKTGSSIYDYKFVKLLQSISYEEWIRNDEVAKCKDRFKETINEWILSTKLNKISGLENFKNRYVVTGTTHSMDEAHWRYRNRKVRLFRGEYPYNRDFCSQYTFIDDDYTISKNDAVIISLPFSGHGKQHEYMENILKMCDIQNVPVFIDCAWFGTCRNINFDFNYECIESVSFSLTKGLGLGDQRIGIEYSKLKNNRLEKINHYNHLCLSNARIGIHFMENLSPDFLQEKYYDTYVEVCDKLNIEKTNTIHVAISDNEKWNEYKRDNKFNRINIGKLVKAVYKKEISLSNF